MSASFAQTMVHNTMNLDVTRMPGVGKRRLAGLCTDLFLIVIAMRESADLGDPQSLRKLVLHYLDLFGKNCKAMGVDQPDIDTARYGLVALLDETVLSIPGPCRDYWISRPLQLDLFGTSIAGQEFYHKLDALLQAPQKHGDVLEVYYLCLSLGFEGRFKLVETRERLTVIEKTGSALSRVRVRTGSGLSPHGIRSGVARTKSRVSPSRFPWWAIPLAGSVITGAVWGGLLILNSMKLGEVVRSLSFLAGGH